jgi:hypothetical protein
MVGETTQLRGQWRTLFVTGGSAGLAGLLLVAASQALVQVGGGEPAFDASGDEILRFFEARNDTLYAIGTYLGLLAVLALARSSGSGWLPSASACSAAGYREGPAETALPSTPERVARGLVLRCGSS